MSNRKIEDLRIWMDAREIVSDIYKLMANNPDYGFKDQIQRASVSIMNNIAEGFEYNLDSVLVHHLNIAKGSCSEVKSMLYLCEDLEYCTKDERTRLQTKLLSVSSEIYRMIQYLSVSKGRNG